MPRSPVESDESHHPGAHAGHGHHHDVDATGLNTVGGATIILALGVVCVGLAVTGTLNNYLQPYFRPLMVLTGAALIGLAVWTLSTLRRAAHASATSAAASWTPVKVLSRTSALVAVPVLLVLVAAPDPLGAAMVSASSVGGGQLSAAPAALSANDSSGFAPLGEGVTDIGLDELYLRHAFGNPEDLNGKTVTTTGFVTPVQEDTQMFGTFMVARFKIFCCAADAIPVAVIINSAQPAPPTDSWVSVTGVVTTTENSIILNDVTVEPIPAPERPYL
ncbi:TIGR03943 family putative permease subunit [Corynebacterium uterequi]|uniref:Putative TIGR03943 family protein n=1 Tax=Corynebacterium uterequi TaxID=1072256 RepID=A0A0G3HF12_9CORY|nr:TIGR03943 family protein [Corynebacterium uterequi]AKK11320.1 putative TIGR03943 family protein [Corynebacterium uterequi]